LAHSGGARQLFVLWTRRAICACAFCFRQTREIYLALTLDRPTGATLGTLSNWRNMRQFITVFGRPKRLMAPLHHAPDNGIGWAGRPYLRASLNVWK